jgi:hypothetical protein
MFNDVFDRFTDRKRLVFLGGTCNDTTWRDQLIPKITNSYHIQNDFTWTDKITRLDTDGFDPRVEDWTPADQQRELEARASADYLVYVITPAMSGVYSIAEVIDDSNKKPDRTIFCYLSTDTVKGKPYKFTDGQKRSLDAVGKMVETNGGKWFKSLDEIITYLNS